MGHKYHYDGTEKKSIIYKLGYRSEQSRTVFQMIRKYK